MPRIAMPRTKLLGLLVAALAPAGNGCIIIGIGWDGPSFWTESRTERLEIDAANLTGVEVQTHNGSISFTSEVDGQAPFVEVTKKGGGLTAEDAERAVDAIEAFVEPDGGGRTRIGWRWRETRSPTWRARVSFDIRAPGDLDVSADTHNGPVKVGGVSGQVHIVTHNGKINVESTTGKLFARTHNGGISAVYSGEDITLVTYNGQIVADLTGCRAVHGAIKTHNGGVEVAVDEAISARLDCRTHNGGIRCGVPLTESEITNRRLTGTIGAGEGRLSLTTHNGGVRLKKAG